MKNFLTLALILLATPALAAPNVVASIKPIHSLAAQIMNGVAEPKLIVDGATSLHEFQMKPSHAKMLQQADVVFLVDPAFESFIPTSPKNVALAKAAKLKLLPIRESGAWEAHEDKHEEHEHASQDFHVWLDPQNAIAMAKVMAEKLTSADKENANTYKRNLSVLEMKLKALDKEISRDIAPMKDVPFVVFHDATQYFEKRYGLNAVGSITLSPEIAPSPKRLAAVKEKIISSQAMCIFKEPTFSDKLIKAINSDGMRVHVTSIDPEATILPAGKELYESSMRALSANINDCLLRDAR